MTATRRFAARAATLLVAVLLLASGSASGQTYRSHPTSPPPAAPTSRPSQDNQPYRLGAGDVLRVDVAGRTDVSGSFTVAEDGTVTIPVVGSVKVQGRTANEVRSDLSRRVSLFDRSSPVVTVTVSEYKSRKVFVLGAVLLPGIYAFAEMPTIWDAIAEAGGPLDDANLGAVELIPGDAADGRQTQTIDIGSAIRETRTDALPRLHPGDTVRVPRGSTSSTIQMMGAIVHPGSLPLDQAPDLVSAVVRSGGPTGDAELEKVQVIRQNGQRITRMKVNLNRYFEKGDQGGNPKLQPGDTVFLPRQASHGISPFAYVGFATAIVGLVTSVVVLMDNNRN
ncbi:MAG TPA: polysaccharide biosynthesis/export family protein [Candidatus Eisenbacteria bacterium]|jgi:polysaccharide export outer membrane protein|nr:polysaccharide biosynthesis/export family protein [Candidatus Eisenbacteria bacterium]